MSFATQLYLKAWGVIIATDFTTHISGKTFNITHTSSSFGNCRMLERRTANRIELPQIHTDY
jgi:hypothetical protein